MGSVGYDKKTLNHGLILDLRMREGAGAFTRDWGDSHYAMSWAGTPAWTNEAGGASSLAFGAALDYLWMTGAASAVFDFTAEDMSMCAWLYPTDVSVSHAIMGRGLVDTGGWEWYYASNNLAFRTNQAGSRCGSSALAVAGTLNQWVFFAFVRKAAFGQMYVNGLPVPTLQSAGGLLDPVAINQNFYLANNSHDNNLVGRLWHPRVWNRRLEDAEVLEMWDKERGLWGL